MLWWVKRPGLGVPLLTGTTGSPNSPTAGGLSDPSTTILFGANQLNFNPSSGGKGEVAYILCPGITLTAGGFYVGEGQGNFRSSSDAMGNPFLFRPFFNVDTNNPNAGLVVAQPGFFSGSVQVTTDRQLFGLEANSISGLYGCDWWQLSGSIGVRYLFLHETLNISQQTTLLQDAIASFAGQVLVTGDQISTLDRFATRDQFVGGQAGLFLEARFDRFWVGTGAKLAIGGTHQEGAVSGFSSVVSSVIPPQTLNIGVLALPSNSGFLKNDGLSVVFDLDAKVGYDITSWLRAVAGYEAIYWTNVVRASQIIPNRVSGVQEPLSPFFGAPGGQQIPAPSLRTSSIWMQGLHIGLEFRY
jgi:hypothetical protein